MEHTMVGRDGCWGKKFKTKLRVWGKNEKGERKAEEITSKTEKKALTIHLFGL